MAQLGTFILLFGWFGFNAASTFAATDLRFTVVAVNTAIAGAFGASVAMFYVMKRMGKPDPGMMVNGMLAGLVAVTAPCAFIQPWAAAVIGSIAAVIVVEAMFFFERKGIDDPVGAISVHGVGGLFGVLCVGIFADGRYGAGWNLTSGSTTDGKGVTGILYGNGEFLGSGSFGKLGFGQLGAQAIAALVICTFMLGLAFVFFKIQNAIMKGGIRPEPADEEAGLDLPEMGVLAYDNLAAPRARHRRHRRGHRHVGWTLAGSVDRKVVTHEMHASGRRASCPPAVARSAVVRQPVDREGAERRVVRFTRRRSFDSLDEHESPRRQCAGDVRSAPGRQLRRVEVVLLGDLHDRDHDLPDSGIRDARGRHSRRRSRASATGASMSDGSTRCAASPAGRSDFSIRRDDR